MKRRQGLAHAASGRELTAIPSMPSLTMSADELVRSIRLRLDVPQADFVDGARCPCRSAGGGSTTDARGWHAWSACPLGSGERYARHNAVLWVLGAALVRLAWRDVVYEPPTVLSRAHRLIPDLGATEPDGGSGAPAVLAPHHLLDVTILHPGTVTHGAVAAAGGAERMLAAAAWDKRQKYLRMMALQMHREVAPGEWVPDPDRAGDKFVPLPVDLFGRLDAGATQ